MVPYPSCSDVEKTTNSPVEWRILVILGSSSVSQASQPNKEMLHKKWILFITFYILLNGNPSRRIYSRPLSRARSSWNHPSTARCSTSTNPRGDTFPSIKTSWRSTATGSMLVQLNLQQASRLDGLGVIELNGMAQFLGPLAVASIVRVPYLKARQNPWRLMTEEYP